MPAPVWTRHAFRFFAGLLRRWNGAHIDRLLRSGNQLHVRAKRLEISAAEADLEAAIARFGEGSAEVSRARAEVRKEQSTLEAILADPVTLDDDEAATERKLLR